MRSHLFVKITLLFSLFILLFLTPIKAALAAKWAETVSYNLYVGNLHSHTSFSDGVERPARAYVYARDTAGIDFLAVTDHNWHLTTAKYDVTRTQAESYTQDGVFVAIAGQEWTTGHGHATVFEADHIFTSLTIAGLYTELIASGSTATFAHPDWPTEGFDSFEYSFKGDFGMNSMEVRCSPELEQYINALDKGWHIGVDGSQDNHEANWGDGPTWTVVLAPSLTKQNILGAMENHRSYSTWDRNFELRFQANGHWMGETFDGVGDLSFYIDLYDPDTDDKIDVVELYEDGLVVDFVYPDTSDFTWEPTVSPNAGEHYYFITVTQLDQDIMVSSPIWYCSSAFDSDGDGIGDTCDNCPDVHNPGQEDNDLDGSGDLCDYDEDNDGLCSPGGSDPSCSGLDNCPSVYNPDQADTFPPGGNGIGDACDCEGNFSSADASVGSNDVGTFLANIGRNLYN